METYLSTGLYGDDPHALDIPDTLFWGALIFLALFLSCFLAIIWLRNRTKTVALEPRPKPPWEGEPMAETSVAETEPLARLLAGISEAQEEELLLAYGPRKVRKAIKERRKAAGHEPGATGKESAFRIRGSLAERQAIRQVQADLERDSARRARRTRH
jgi:hypothetical protein